MCKITISILVLIILCSGKSYSQNQVFEVWSPDKRLVMHLTFSDSEGVSKLTYRVNYEGKEVIRESALGIESGNADWQKGMQVGETQWLTHDSTWHPVYGERNTVRDHYNQAVFPLVKKDNPRKELQVIVRAYDAGIAFRYRFSESPQGGDYLHITDEHTQFALPEGTLGYFTARAQTEYKRLPINDFPAESERPLTLALPNGLYASLAEAEMVNFSRMRFEKDGQPNTLRCSLYGDVDEITPFATPWRVVMVARQPGQLLENNDLILNLNPACALENTSWIKPGKVMREVTLSTAGAKKLVDFAVKRHLQYIHFDAGWYGYEYVSGSDATTVTVDPRRNPKGDLDLQQAIDYAKSKDIGVIVYVNQRALAAQLDSILPLYKKWGISGIKFGFVQVGSHKWTTWMHEAIRKCAQYGLVVDIHDEYRPTGFSRTYPNLMTQEGIRGNEEFPDATHNTILPFTRFIAGAADYTICYYRQDFGKTSKDENGVPRGKFIKTSPAHQLALSVICYSPLQYMYWYDKPEDSQEEPELEFFDAVPTVWDDTKVIHGEIGQYITMARKSGNDWFLGTITNNDHRQLNIPLSFLPAGQTFDANIYSDDSSVNTRTKVSIQKLRVNSSSVLNTKLIGSGGQAVWIKPLAQ